MPAHTGTGPGVITRDGCAVEFYALLPPGRDPGVIHAALPPGASILELGAGTGRVTRPLAALGHEVVAVDESAEMLERIGGADVVHGRIETLNLRRRFEAVLLATHLINDPSDDTCRAFLRTCRRHVRDGGSVLIERRPPGWYETAAAKVVTWEGIVFRLRDVRRPAPGTVTGTMDYDVDGRRWTHSFTSRRLDDSELADLLSGAGLRFDAVLTEDGAWVRAVPDV